MYPINNCTAGNQYLRSTANSRGGVELSMKMAP